MKPILLGLDPKNEPGLLLYAGPEVLANAPDVGLKTPSGQTVTAKSNGAQIYIVDKVTSGVEVRGIVSGERFFAIGGTSVGDGLINRMPGNLSNQNTSVLQAGTVQRFAMSDGLNPQGGFSTTQTLPDQFNKPQDAAGSPTARPSAFTRYNAFRPESTFAQEGPRGDTHLYVVGGDGTAARPNSAMRADLQILPDGSGTGAVSVGGIVPGVAPGATPDANTPLTLAGRTVGSTRRTPGSWSSAINSNLGSLATAADGQGAHLLGGPTLNNGQVSHFAVSQADPRVGPTATNTADTANTPPVAVQPGIIQPVNGDAGIEFGYTRLATNVGTSQQPGGSATLQGYASAIVERTGTSGQGIYAQGTGRLGDVTITRTLNANTFDARIVLRPTSAGQGAFEDDAAPAPVANPQPVTLSMGDRGVLSATPRSAYVSDSTFAAIGDNHAMTSVDRDLLAGLPDAARAAMPASNEHVAWGYFLGDLAQPTAAQRDHVNLGFWVAGRAVDASTLSMLTGTATYTGGMIGTAVQPGKIATATGNFQQSWNFGARSGTLNATFDGRSWSGADGLKLAMLPGANVFNGNGTGAGGILAVQGSFFNNGALFGTATPQAVGGHFAISAPGYGANGVMVGTRR